MWRRMRLGRLQAKVLLLTIAIVVIPMLVAAGIAAAWVSATFEQRLQQWITEASHAGQQWLEANQNDASVLGKILATDPRYVSSLQRVRGGRVPDDIHKIASAFGLDLFQVYDADHRLIFSSAPVTLNPVWAPGQTAAVLRVMGEGSTKLVAAGVTPVMMAGNPRYYLLYGSFIDQDFIAELSNLNGLTNRLYYLDAGRYLDVFSSPGQAQPLQHLARDVMRRLTVEKRPYYTTVAEAGDYRGVYVPIADASGHVEAILFGGLERRGAQELIASRAVLFSLIIVLGLGLGAGTGWLLSRFLIRPVAQLRRAVVDLSGQNYKAAVPVDSDDELGDLARAFNAMAQRLKQARDEEQLRFRQDKLTALGEISAALAHEIRNPIGVINTAAGILQRPGVAEARREQLVRMIHEESQRVGELVQEFLQLSPRRPTGRAQLDAIQPLERAVSAALAGQEQIEVVREYQAEETQVVADAGLLMQAWSNILANALQAIGDAPGRITLRTERRDGGLWIAVEDSGPGIPPEVGPRLFEPFFTTKVQGTGLGLSVAHALVEACGARLQAVEPVAGGACFAIFFPDQE